MQSCVEAEELVRRKMQRRGAQIDARGSASCVANRYGRARTSGLTVADVQAWPDLLQAVTAEDIMAAAAAVFQRETSVTGYLDRPLTQAEATQ